MGEVVGAPNKKLAYKDNYGWDGGGINQKLILKDKNW